MWIKFLQNYSTFTVTTNLHFRHSHIHNFYTNSKHTHVCSPLKHRIHGYSMGFHSCFILFVLILAPIIVFVSFDPTWLTLISCCLQIKLNIMLLFYLLLLFKLNICHSFVSKFSLQHIAFHLDIPQQCLYLQLHIDYFLMFIEQCICIC